MRLRAPCRLSSFPLPLIALLSAVPSGAARSEDWPSWRGPERDGISREKNLLRAWPREGPPLAWKARGCGEGYSTPSVASGRIFLMGNRGGEEKVIALSTDGGNELWSAPLGSQVRVDYSGPRCTPTVDGAALYALGAGGTLICLESGTGKERWRKDLRKDFGGRRPNWGYSESPLVDGGLVLCTPGGREVTLVALNKETGEVVWKSPIPRGARQTAHEVKPNEWDGAQYSSIVRGDLGGLKQYVQFLETGVAGVSAKDGTFLWRYNKPANGTANISTPIVQGNQVFAASGYGTGGGLVKLTPQRGKVKAEEVYFFPKIRNHHGGVILVGDHLYGFDEGILRCIDFRGGKQTWENRSVGKGSLLYADGHLYARSEGGAVALVEANPRAYVEKGRFEQPERSGQNAWPHPVIADGILYLRDQDVLLAYDVRAKSARTASAKKRQAKL